MNERADPDSVSSDAERPAGVGRLPSLQDLTDAVALLTRLPLARPDPRGVACARAVIFFPLVGLVIGAALDATNWLLLTSLPRWLVAVVLVGMWEVGCWGPERGRLVGTFGPIIKLACMALARPRPLALLFAPLLARWSMVVLATGARDATAPGRKFNPAISFREFALTSVFTFAVVFAVAEAFGIVIVVCAAAVTLGLRLGAHRWLNGISWRFLTSAAQAIEALVIAFGVFL